MAKCSFPNCTANAMTDNSGRCYWHNENVDPDEKQRNRAKGGSNTRRIEPWRLPEQLQPINDLAGLKNLYNSAIGWLTQGVITPAQAHSLRSLAGGLRDVFELQLYAELIRQRREMLDKAAAMGINNLVDVEQLDELEQQEGEKWLLPQDCEVP